MPPMDDDPARLERDMRGLIPLFNFHMTDESLAITDDFTICRLNEDERKVIGARTHPMVAAKCTFGIETKWKERLEALNVLNVNVGKVLLSAEVVPALRLFDAGDVTFPIVLWTMLGKGPNPLGFRGWATMTGETSQHFGKPLILTDSRAVEFKRFWEAISASLFSRDQFKNGDIRLDIAVSRFNASYWQKAIEDRFIDIMIGFESLLGDQTVEATNRLINRLTLLLGKDDDERTDLQWFLRKAYDTRSDIIHGRRIKESEIMKETRMTFKTMVFESQRLLAKTIKTCVFIGSKHRSNRKELIELLDDSMISSKMRDTLFDGLISVQDLVFTDAHSFVVQRKKRLLDSKSIVSC